MMRYVPPLSCLPFHAKQWLPVVAQNCFLFRATKRLSLSKRRSGCFPFSILLNLREPLLNYSTSLSTVVILTLSLPILLRLYTLPYWSNPPFLISDILALWCSALSARAPECQKIKMVGQTSMALNPSNSSNLEQLALNGLRRRFCGQKSSNLARHNTL